MRSRVYMLPGKWVRLVGAGGWPIWERRVGAVAILVGVSGGEHARHARVHRDRWHECHLLGGRDRGDSRAALRVGVLSGGLFRRRAARVRSRARVSPRVVGSSRVTCMARVLEVWVHAHLGVEKRVRGILLGVLPLLRVGLMRMLLLLLLRCLRKRTCGS